MGRKGFGGFGKGFGYDYLRGHARDGGFFQDKGHDLHGRGKGIGHDSHWGNDCGPSGKDWYKGNGFGGRDWHKGSGSGGRDWHKGSGFGGKDWHKGSGFGGKDWHKGGGDYLCGGNRCIEVVENTTAVTDLDTPFGSKTGDAGVIYAVLPRGDGALFTISSDGKLALREAEDFENPTDPDQHYTVTVRTIDICNPCRYVDREICVKITNDPSDDDPQGGQNAGPILEKIFEVGQITAGMGGQVVATFTVSDADTPVDQLLFRLEGNDAAAFTIDTSDADLSDGFQVSLIIKAANLGTRFGAGPDGIFDATLFVEDETGLEDASDISIPLQILAG